MKWISGSVCAALVAVAAVAVASADPVGAAAGDPPSPYDACTRTTVNTTTENLSCTFTQPGPAQTLTIPGIARQIEITAAGGRGWDPTTGHLDNAVLKAGLPSSFAGQTASIRVGGDAEYAVGGSNGGGSSLYGGGGGGASDVSFGGVRAFVAPGGGGSGSSGLDPSGDPTSGGVGGFEPFRSAGNGAAADWACGLGGGRGADSSGAGGQGGYADDCTSDLDPGADGGTAGTTSGAGGQGGHGDLTGVSQCAGNGGTGGGGGGGAPAGGGGGAGGQTAASAPYCGGGGGGAAGTPMAPGGGYVLTVANVTPYVTISWQQTLTITSSGQAPAATVGSAYSYALTTDASGATFRVVSGSTPPGLTLSPSGLLSGTPTTVGTTGFTVEATDADDAAQRDQVVSVTVAQAPVTFTNAPPNATKGKPYSFTFAATNCTGCSFTRVSGQGGFPHGLSMTSGGVLSGTPTTVESASFEVTATASDGRSATQRFAMKVLAATTTTPSLKVNDVSATENGGKATFTVSLSAPAAGTVTVHYATADGTAKAPGDYTAKSGTLSFSAGQTSKTVTVVVVNDTRPELAETFRLVLSGATGATIADNSGTATIAAND